MAGQTAKKELLEETLHHHPEGSEEEVDKEWEEFTRLMAKLKESRRNRPHRYTRDRIFRFRINKEERNVEHRVLEVSTNRRQARERERERGGGERDLEITHYSCMHNMIS
jgi:hypothetical protein